MLFAVVSGSTSVSVAPERSRHHHRDLLVRKPALAGAAAAFASFALQFAGAFLRFRDVGLVRLHDASQLFRLGLGRHLQQAMTPVEGGAQIDADAFGRLAQRQAIHHRLAVGGQLVALLQERQRRAGQRIEARLAGPAAIPPQSRSKAPLLTRALTVRTCRLLDEPGFDQSRGLRHLTAAAQGLRQRLTLLGRQLVELFDKLLKLRGLHLCLPPATDRETQHQHDDGTEPWHLMLTALSMTTI